MSDEYKYDGADNLEAMSEARNYNQFLLDIVESTCGPGKVLDFGAGIGTFSFPLSQSGREVVCVEPDPTLGDLLLAKGLQVSQGLAGLESASFDSAFSLNVLEHIEDDAKAVDSLASLLKPGGSLLIYVPAFPVLFSSMDAKVGHFRRYRRRGLTKLVKDAGLVVERSDYVDCLGFFATLLFKLIGNKSGDIGVRGVVAYDRLIFPISRLLDRIFKNLFGKNVMITARKPL